MKEKRLLTQKEAAEYLGINPKAFKKLIINEEIGFKRVGKTKRFTLTELEKWLNNQDYHIEFTKEARSTTHTSRLKPTTMKEFSFERVLEQITMTSP